MNMPKKRPRVQTKLVLICLIGCCFRGESLQPNAFPFQGRQDFAIPKEYTGRKFTSLWAVERKKRSDDIEIAVIGRRTRRPGPSINNRMAAGRQAASSSRPRRAISSSLATKRSPMSATTTSTSPRESTASYQMLKHQILTAEEEQSLGRKVRRANEVKEMMAKLIEQKHDANLDKIFEEQWSSNEIGSELMQLGMASPVADDDDEDLDGLSIYGLSKNPMLDFDKNSLTSQFESTEDLEDGWESSAFSFTSSRMRKNKRSSFSSLENVQLTEKDIVERLNIPGGKAELQITLIDGALAREKLISSNVRLVVSIAKKWFKQGLALSGKGEDTNMKKVFAGSWTRPSLDEAVQEGIVGLAEAADRFDPERKFKFGTYATYWVTNSIRLCFQRAATGCLRVPPHYHMKRQQYQKILSQHFREKGYNLSVEEIAKQMGMTAERLRFVLRSTESLISIDSPKSRFAFPGQGGKAGAIDPSNENEFVLANILTCSEPLPEELVEKSLLRQCLENAMATELSPHERDVVRLRHGLDDGVFRTAREVSEIFGGSVSVGDVRVAEMKAFQKLRSPYSVHTAHLLGFLDYVGGDIETANIKR